MSSDIQTALSALDFDIQSILGAAIFDFNGLPKDYFTSAEYQDISWVQTVFQALGLRSLLVSSLQLETFNYAIVHGADHCAIITKQNHGYVATLVSQSVLDKQATVIIQWMQNLHPGTFTSTPHFIRA